MSMQYRINGFSLQKAGDVEGAALPVKAFTNSMVRDKVRQRIAARAFSEPVVAWFNNNGVYDYFHQSANMDLSKAERDENMIGGPTGFSWEDHGGVRMPTSYGNITVDHPVVDKIKLVRHLNAGNNIFGVSIGGQVLHKARGDDEEIIDEIFWDHLAIAPRHKIICPGSSLMLRKAEDGSPTALAVFDCLERFCADLPHVPEETEYLHKALVAYQGERGLDVRDLTGAGALQTGDLKDDPLLRRDVELFYKLRKAGVLNTLEDARHWYNGRAEAVIDAVNKS